MAAEKRKAHILISTSVPGETEGIKREMDAFETFHAGGRTVLAGSIGDSAVRLIETGPGLINTTQGLTAAVENCMPEMILMTGCAGGFARAGFSIGDIAVASEENDAQLGIEPENSSGRLTPLPFNLGIINGVGIKHRIALDPHSAKEALGAVREAFGDPSINIRTGPFVTVSTITATDERAEQLFDRFHACMENMEGFAGAYIAGLYSIPFLEIRCASNLVGLRDRASWDLDIACERSAKAAVAWLKRKR